MLPPDTDRNADPPSRGDARSRARRLIHRIEQRYGLGSEQAGEPGAAAVNDTVGAVPSEEQMLVNEALVAKVMRCERSGEALRASERKLQRLLAYQRQLKEDERRRVSGEIHDVLGQNLLALRLDVATFHQRTGALHPRLHEWAGSALANLDQTLRTVRALIADLRPYEIELGLQAAIEWELNRFRRMSGVDCHVEIDSRLRNTELSDEQVLALYRALQECLTATARRGAASRVDVVLACSSGTLTMTVSDNGAGVDIQKGDADGLSLMLLRERVGALGGRVTVKAVPMHGTAVTICLPVVTPKRIKNYNVASG